MYQVEDPTSDYNRPKGCRYCFVSLLSSRGYVSFLAVYKNCPDEKVLLQTVLYIAQ